MADKRSNDPCWTGYKMVGMKKKGNRPVPNCVPEAITAEPQSKDPRVASSRFDASDSLVGIYKHDTPGQSKLKTVKRVVREAIYECNGNCTCGMAEAEYQGRSVPLGKPMKGDVAKSKVYVKNPSSGKVVKVNFGDKNMTIKKDIPARRKSFRARHRCENPGPRTKARYWSCRAW